jgi:hypothetical protein
MTQRTEGAPKHGNPAHLLPITYKRMISEWLEEDTPSFDYGGFVVGDEMAEARLLGKSEVCCCACVNLCMKLSIEEERHFKACDCDYILFKTESRRTCHLFYYTVYHNREFTFLTTPRAS